MNARGNRIPSYDGGAPSRPAGPLLPALPFASRPAPSADQTHSRQNSGSSSRSGGSGRRASIHTALKPGPSVSIRSGQTGHAPPGSPRNQSWDGVVGGGGRAAGRPGSSDSSNGRARKAAFPKQGPSMSQVQNRSRDESKWVDPAKWNGPL